MDTRENFNQFLKSTDSIREIKKGKWLYKIIKIPYGDELEILYLGREYDNNFSFNMKLEYAGIYNKEIDELYDPNYRLAYDLLEYTWKDNPYKSKEEIFNEINNYIQNIINYYVEENKKEFYDSVKEDYEPNISEKEVYGNFINNEYEINYKDDYNSTDPILLLECLDGSHMNGPNQILYDYADDYMSENKNYIGQKLITIDLKNKYLKDIINNKNHQMHKIKNIIDSLEKLDCVNVHVFINKNGVKFDFRYGKDVLMQNYYHGYLLPYNIPAHSRKIFEDLYGRRVDFYYTDIVKIEYRNQVVYEDKNFDYECENKKETSGMEL